MVVLKEGKGLPSWLTGGKVVLTFAQGGLEALQPAAKKAKTQATAKPARKKKPKDE